MIPGYYDIVISSENSIISIEFESNSAKEGNLIRVVYYLVSIRSAIYKSIEYSCYNTVSLVYYKQYYEFEFYIQLIPRPTIIVPVV